MWDLAVIYCCVMMTQSFNLLGLSLTVLIRPSFSLSAALIVSNNW